MTVIERAHLKVCTFCWEFHHQYMKGVSFNYTRKEAVTECWPCKQVMCADCQMSSQLELQNDPLCIYGLTVCQRCMKSRRLTTMHKDYEAIAKKELELFKKTLRRKFYDVTQEKYAVGDRHL